MSLHRHTAVLLSVANAVNTSQTGPTYVVLPSDGDNVNDAAQSFRAVFSLSQSGGATSPTTDAVLETSVDGVNWVPAIAATQLTASTTLNEMKPIAALGPYVRARTTVGGGTAPNHTAKITLVSNGGFRLKAA